MATVHTTEDRRGEATTWLSPEELAHEIHGWILDGEMRQYSPSTIASRRTVTNRLLGFLNEWGKETCGPSEIRAYLGHLSGYGERPASPALKPTTVRLHFNVLASLFSFLVDDGICDSSPMERLKPPVAHSDQVQPFTADEVHRLIDAARKSHNPRRDPALLMLLLDTGLRASELCSLKLGDVDFDTRRFTVRGKGNKTRAVYFGTRTARALWSWIDSKDLREHPERALFFVTRGSYVGEAFSRHSLLKLVKTIGRRAQVKDVHPHRFRHTFCVSYLTSGGNIYSLQALMGHASLQMLQRYLAFSQADLQNQHRIASPADSLFQDRKRR